MSDIKTCRFCGFSNYEQKHPAANSAWVRVSIRHNAHLKCGVEKQGEAFIRKLATHKIDALPYFELKQLGMVDVVRDEMNKRARPEASK